MSDPAFSDVEVVVPWLFVIDGVVDFDGLVGVWFVFGCWNTSPVTC